MARTQRAETRQKLAADRAEAPKAPETPTQDDRATQRREARAEKDRARRERAEAKQAARRDKAAARPAKDDHIVEPPREPKKSLAQKLRARRSSTDSDAGSKADAAPGGSRRGKPRGRRTIAMLAGIVGAVGLVCSVLLAVGALLVAVGADGGGAYDVLSGICDTLAGPLRDVFSFSGTNADLKETLVAWGAGAIIYLVVSMIAQSLSRSLASD